jgi:hypothetical protein
MSTSTLYINAFVSAGTCTFKDGNYCIVTLSEPLLKFRTKKDMFETLLVSHSYSFALFLFLLII